MGNFPLFLLSLLRPSKFEQKKICLPPSFSHSEASASELVRDAPWTVVVSFRLHWRFRDRCEGAIRSPRHLRSPDRFRWALLQARLRYLLHRALGKVALPFFPPCLQQEHGNQSATLLCFAPNLCSTELGFRLRSELLIEALNFIEEEDLSGI